VALFSSLRFMRDIALKKAGHFCQNHYIGILIIHEHVLDSCIQGLFSILLNLINIFRNSLRFKTCSYGAETLRMDFRRKRKYTFISKKHNFHKSP
jgi:hypothetical protein